MKPPSFAICKDASITHILVDYRIRGLMWSGKTACGLSVSENQGDDLKSWPIEKCRNCERTRWADVYNNR